MMSRQKTNMNTGGYSLIELIFYIALFAVFMLAIINSFMTMAQSFRETSVQSDFTQNSSVLEKISREVRQAYSINAMSSTDLKLNTKDELDNLKTVRFALSGGDIQFYENDVLTGNLNTPNTQVTNLTFTEITTTLGKAIKIDLSVRSTRDKLGRVEDFYNTVVLRGNY